MSDKYARYLSEHISNVGKAATWIVDNLRDEIDMSDDEVGRLVRNVRHHDRSKYGADEYFPYDAYFYGEPDADAFDRAWLHHIHHNPHHWQHWLLMNDDGKYRDPDKLSVLEMPKEYAVEMVADWWSFSWKTGNLDEVLGWYDTHRDNIILHDETRAYVERILDGIGAKV